MTTCLKSALVWLMLWSLLQFLCWLLTLWSMLSSSALMWLGPVDLSIFYFVC
jgi:hypothetical protein